MKYIAELLGILAVAFFAGYSIGFPGWVETLGLVVLFLIGDWVWRFIWNDQEGHRNYRALCVSLFVGMLIKIYSSGYIHAINVFTQK